jgi:hypothetical protein
MGSQKGSQKLKKGSQKGSQKIKKGSQKGSQKNTRDVSPRFLRL